MSNQRKARLYLELVAPVDEIERLRQQFPTVTVSINETDHDLVKMELIYSQERDIRKEVYDFIKKQDWTILEMQRHISSLEDVFRNLTAGGRNE
jgi:hypothetical protein